MKIVSKSKIWNWKALNIYNRLLKPCNLQVNYFTFEMEVALNTNFTYVYSNIPLFMKEGVTTLLWERCEDEIHTPKIGTWESSETPKISKFDGRGQNTSHLNNFYIIGKLSKCRCRKCPRMGHLDICSTSYGKKKGRESNWQFNSWPLKVRNWPDHGACS
jgi:hypothetical protein